MKKSNRNPDRHARNAQREDGNRRRRKQNLPKWRLANERRRQDEAQDVENSLKFSPPREVVDGSGQEQKKGYIHITTPGTPIVPGFKGG